VRTAPHNAPVHRVTETRYFEDPAAWAITWRAYCRKHEAKE